MEETKQDQAADVKVASEQPNHPPLGTQIGGETPIDSLLETAKEVIPALETAQEVLSVESADKSASESCPCTTEAVAEDAQSVPFEHLVDDSHSHTSVYCDGYIGPGNAHHHYVVKNKKGTVIGRFYFQDGPIQEAGVNGIMNEDLLAILIDRLRGFNSGKYACKENVVALSKLELALEVLKERTQKRVERGVEGTHTV